MAKRAQKVADEQAEASTDLMVMASVDALSIFTDREQFNAFYAKVKAETDKLNPDISTQAGRDRIRATAYKVTRAKTTLDKAALGLTEQWRRQTADVNAARREMVDQMDQLAEDVRRPLTAWEEAERARVAAVQAKIDAMKAAAVISEDDTAATVRERGRVLWETPIEEDEFRDLTDEAKEVKATTAATLQRALARLTQEEADRAELEQRRAADAEREEREAREREERERAERVRVEQEQAEQRRKDAEEAEATRVREAAERAAEEARQEEANRARAAEEAREREHQAQLAEARREREEAEAEARRERERREAEEARIKREAEETRLREADRAHRRNVQGAAKRAIMTCGADDDTAGKIVLAIIAGEIPHTKLTF